MRARLRGAALTLLLAVFVAGCALEQKSPAPEQAAPEQSDITKLSEPTELSEPTGQSAKTEPTERTEAPAPEPPAPEQTAPEPPAPAEPEPESPKQPVFDNDALPEGFSYVKAVNPNIAVDLRYAGMNNFTGFVVDGYNSTQAAILTDAAANALSEAQELLAEEGLGLIIYDAYRPMKAARFFVQWAKSDDERMKERFYPKLEKRSLFPMGFIAEKSGHSKGNTVDLTMCDLSTGAELDMGSDFDLFDDISAHGTELITKEQAENREKLKNTMVRCGFIPYGKEWWHYTYSADSFPGEYFDFDVE